MFLAWYAAMKRLGVDRTGLFNGLIPIASLAAVVVTGTGTITPPQCLAALTVLAGVILGLGRTPRVPAGTGLELITANRMCPGRTEEAAALIGRSVGSLKSRIQRVSDRAMPAIEGALEFGASGCSDS